MHTHSKKYSVLFLLVLLCLQLPASNKKKTDIPDDCNNYVLIEGSSNINRFEFVNFNPSVANKQRETQKTDGQNIKIPVKKFTTRNNMMRRDFLEMLNAAEYPYIRINIESADSAYHDKETGLTYFDTKITLAGNTQSYRVPCKIISCENGQVVKGKLELELSAFDIDPPQKVLGTVKVNNEVFITFAFNYI